MYSAAGETQAIMTWWLKRAVHHEPRTNEVGDKVLFHGFPMYLLSICCIGMGIFVIVMALTVAPIGTEGNDPIAYILLLSFFFSTGIYCFLEGLEARVTINNIGIIAEAIWPWYPKTILWKDIRRVSYSSVWSHFIISDTNGSKVRINGYFYGIKYLVYNFEQRLDPSAYQKAKWFINEIRKMEDHPILHL